MNQETKDVLLVPGLHPRGCEALQRYAYKTVVPTWRSNGYNVVLRQFGWDNRMPLADRQAALCETVQDLPDNSYAIGASAGGLAVLNAFRDMPSKFHRIITIASPLNLTEADFANFKDNPFVPIPDLLIESYQQTDEFLNTISLGGLAKIVSIHGHRDPRVSPQWSQRSGIANLELPTHGHGQTIMSALRRYRHHLQGILES